MAFGTFDQPFSAQSPWNVRPASFTLGTYVIPPTAYDAYIGGGPYSVTRFLANPSDPPQVVYGINGPGTSSLQNTDAETYDESITLPHFPPSVVGASGADGHADIVDPALNRIYSFYQLTQHGSEFWAQGFSWTALDGRGWGDPAHYQQGARATGVPTGGGIIPFAFVDGDHYPFALAMSLDGAAISPVTPGYVFPATNADYDYLSRTGTIPEGALLMLPSSFPEFSVPSSDGVHERLNKIIRTLKLYGARLVDRNTNTQFVLYVEGTSDRWIYPSGYTTTIAHEMNAMADALRMATVTSWIDGNGNPFQLPQNLNMLSLRPGGGSGYALETGSTKGTFDTFTQSVTFANDGIYTAIKTPDIAFPYQATWVKPNAGDMVTLSVTATGGAKLQVQIFNSTPQFDSGLLGDGESATFAWPAADVAKRIRMTSGPSGGGTLKALMIGPATVPPPSSPTPPTPPPPTPSPPPTPTPTPPPATVMDTAFFSMALRFVAGTYSGGGGFSNSIAGGRKTLFPRQDIKVLDDKGCFTDPWYRLLQFVYEKKLGGDLAPSIPDIQGNVVAVQGATASTTGQIALITQVVETNAASQVATIEVQQAAGTPGATQIPAPVLTVPTYNPRITTQALE